MRTTEPSAFINCIKTQHQRHFYRFQCVTDDHTNMKHSRLIVKLCSLKRPRIEPARVYVRAPRWLCNLILSAGCCTDGNERTVNKTAGSQKPAERRMWIEATTGEVCQVRIDGEAKVQKAA